MKEIITYTAQAGVLAACSWLVYKALFSRDTLHHLRRGVLLTLLAASLALPVCRVTLEHKTAVDLGIDRLVAVANDAGTEAVVGIVARNDLAAQIKLHAAEAMPARRNLVPDLFVFLGIVYIAGVVAMLGFRLAGVAQVRRIMRRTSNRFRTDDGIEVLLVDGEVPPFSFGGRIVLSESDRKSEGADMILRHETVHVRQRHGIDLAAMNLATALLWFNPFVWLLRRELILVHEIAADSGVVRSGFDAKIYQYLLISKIALRKDLLPVANHFRTSDLRKRIITMKRQTSRSAAFKTLLLLPLVAIALVAFSETRHVAAEVATDTADMAVQKTITADKPTEEPEITMTYRPKREELNMPFEGEKRTHPNGVSYTFGPVGLFGERTHPVTGETAFHSGIDVVPSNDTIRAPYSGVVKSAAFEQGMGNKLEIDHGNSFETAYGHLASFLVSEGEQVRGGQPIAIVGNTGVSTGKHLHLETRVNGELKDPLETLFGMKVYKSGKKQPESVFISISHGTAHKNTP